MGCGTSFVKYVLFFFNLVVALFGLAVIGIGAAVLLNWAVIKDLLRDLTVAPWVFIGIGAVTFIIAFFGCCGAIRESHCMVVTYAIFLLVIIIVQVVLGVLLFVYGDSIKENLLKTVKSSFDQRAVDPVSNVFIDNIQQQLECCGMESPSDYGFNIVNLPKSCCSSLSAIGKVLGDHCTIADVNSGGGCLPRVGELYQKFYKVIAGVAIGVACVEVVGALFSLCLANSIRNMDRRSRY